MMRKNAVITHGEINCGFKQRTLTNRSEASDASSAVALAEPKPEPGSRLIFMAAVHSMQAQV